METESKTKHYEVLQNLPGGIKKGDIVTTTPSRGGNTTKSQDGKLLPYDPVTEPTFFKEVIPLKSIFQKDQLVMIREKLSIPVKVGFGNGTSRRRTQYETVPPWSELKVLAVFKSKDSRQPVIMYSLYHADTNQTFEVAENKLMPYKKYYFISSNGTVQTAAVGQNRNADLFRTAIGNYSEDAEEIRALLRQIDSGVIKLRPA